MRSAMPAARAAVVVAIPVALLVAGAVPASAADTTSRSEMAFGLLGPVGLIAVALGIVGMAFGVFRQRRKARAAAVAPAPAPAQPAIPHVAAMAEAVLADDVLTRPQRP
ncbi:hypothetical protein [Amycolatopsis lurida]|uniref:Uncharacterized protein n=1 Tax=Amycolatopsis lurida NRRL 2430 TaxID=1460371 RepID=A0A2P2G2G2_AMYLU|nr:hypothetical protein [Amycolatopsis lurida]KFU83168.1 hypothetical protein BB31_01360 [Amycolatopsis lurida NRRL 2430]